jgi:hypothetical protein
VLVNNILGILGFRTEFFNFKIFGIHNNINKRHRIIASIFSILGNYNFNKFFLKLINAKSVQGKQSFETGFGLVIKKKPPRQ